MDSSTSSSSIPVQSFPSTSLKPVVRCGHIIPSIRLTPPDSRPAMAPEIPEQDLGPNSLFVPLKTEEIGWEEGGLIWAAKRYCYPTVNLYGGSDDHVIGTYRGGPKGYRFINITDKAFALASEDEDDISNKPAKTSKDGKRSSLPNGPATKASIVDNSVILLDAEEETDCASLPSLTPSSTPASSRRGSSSTEDGDSSGVITPTEGEEMDAASSNKIEEKMDAAEILDSALSALQHSEKHYEELESERDHKKTKMAKRTGSIEINSETINAARLAGPLRSQLINNALGLDRTLTLSENVPFTDARGRSTSRRSENDDFTAGWSYEQNMRNEYLQKDQFQL